MALVYAQNVIEIAAIGSMYGKQVANIWHLFNDEAAGSDASKAQDFANNWQDHMMNRISNGYKIERFEWRSLDPDDKNVGTINPNQAKRLVGAQTAEAAPPNVAFLIHKTTLNRPRGRRDGRCFLPGVPEGQVDGSGNLLAGVAEGINTDLVSFWNGLDDSDAVGAGSGICVLETTPESRQPGTLPVTLTYRRVTQLTCDIKVATQRERLR